MPEKRLFAAILIQYARDCQTQEDNGQALRDLQGSRIILRRLCAYLDLEPDYVAEVLQGENLRIGKRTKAA